MRLFYGVSSFRFGYFCLACSGGGGAGGAGGG